MRLFTQRVRIIPFEPLHAPHVYRWFHSGDYENFFGNMPLMTIGDATNFNSNGMTFMIVSPTQPDVIYGMFAMTHIQERHRNMHFGMLIDQQFQNKQLSKESMSLMIYHIMNGLNFYKVIALVASDNEVSKKLTESFGFELEGTLKQEVYHDGEFHDMIRYRMTKGNFNKRYKSQLESMEIKT